MNEGKKLNPFIARLKNHGACNIFETTNIVSYRNQSLFIPFLHELSELELE
jgi:hypothetical protein